MTREEYISALQKELAALTEDERADICRDFEEHFAIGLSQGKSEHEISAELGNPFDVARNYFEETDPETPLKEQSGSAAAGDTYGSTADGAAQSDGQAQPGTVQGGIYPPYNGVPQTKDTTGAKLFIVLLNAFVSVWVIFSLICTLLALWCVPSSLFVSGIFSFIAIPTNTYAAGIQVCILLGVAGITAGIGLGFLLFLLTKLFVKGMKLYCRWCKRVYNEGF